VYDGKTCHCLRRPPRCKRIPESGGVKWMTGTYKYQKTTPLPGLEHYCRDLKSVMLL